MSISGLPEMYGEYVGVLTAEGENYLLTQQTTRYLLKVYDKSIQTGQSPVGNSKYLDSSHVEKLLRENCTATSESDFLNPQLQLTAYQRRTARLLDNTAAQLREDVDKGTHYMEAWNNVLVEVYRISKAHCMYTIVSNFINAVEDIRKSNPALHPVLNRLCNLFTLHRMEEDIGEFLEDGYLNSTQASLLRKQVRNLLIQLRPDSVPLVDAFNYSDYSLNSALGIYSGNVYETMYEWVQKSPLNQSDVAVGYEEYLKPLITAKL
jgi:acyl-CoA oxidase